MENSEHLTGSSHVEESASLVRKEESENQQENFQKDGQEENAILTEKSNRSELLGVTGDRSNRSFMGSSSGGDSDRQDENSQMNAQMSEDENSVMDDESKDGENIPERWKETMLNKEVSSDSTWKKELERHHQESSEV